MLFALLCFFGLEGIEYGLNTLSGKSNPDKFGIYTDGNGAQRLSKNGKRVVDTWNKDGDYIIKYAKNGSTVLNITDKESKEKEKIAIKKGNTFYLRQPETGWRGKLGDNDIRGERYCKVGNPYEYYVKRIVDYRTKDGKGYVGSFYMDMNCQLICPTDEQIEKDKCRLNNNKGCLISEDNSQLYETIIKEWNKHILNPFINVKYNEYLSMKQQC